MRRLLALVKGLPQEAGVVRFYEPAAEWSSTEYLLAVIAELIDLSNRMYLQAHNANPGRPLMIQRPGIPAPVVERRQATFEETLDFFARRG